MREVGLQNIQQVGVLTTYGFNSLQIAISGDAGRRMIAGGMRGLFASDCTMSHQAMYNLQDPNLTREDRVEFLDEVEGSFKKW